MVSSARRRDAVAYLRRRHPKVSERRACRVVGQHRSTQRYRGIQPDFERWLIKRMNELAAKHPRYGYRRIWALLRGEGFEVNKKRIERLWRLEGHRVPPQRASRQKKNLGAASNAAWNLAATKPNDVWSYDFVADRTTDGGSLRILNVVDEYTRVALGTKVERAIGTRDVQLHLEQLFESHGKPRIIRSDNGREFTAELLAEWLSEQGVAQAFIEPGTPQQNCFVERFNGTMRDEKLNGESFHSVLEARVVLTEWLIEYNEVRPHRGLGMLTPAEFARRIRVGSE